MPLTDCGILGVDQGVRNTGREDPYAFNNSSTTILVIKPTFQGCVSRSQGHNRKWYLGKAGSSWPKIFSIDFSKALVDVIQIKQDIHSNLSIIRPILMLSYLLSSLTYTHKQINVLILLKLEGLNKQNGVKPNKEIGTKAAKFYTHSPVLRLRQNDCSAQTSIYIVFVSYFFELSGLKCQCA